MIKNIFVFSVAYTLLFLFTTTTLVFAQTANENVETTVLPLGEFEGLSEAELQEIADTFNNRSFEGGNANCFDYYSFGSVQVPITATLPRTISGTTMGFSGTIQNENSYPIVDGSVYVKIFKLRDDSSKSVNGPDVVDQFLVKNDLVIPANGEVPIQFSWDIPAWATSGTYQAATFFVASDKFNLLGLSFTDDIVGNTASFDVQATGEKGVYLDKDTVTYPKYDAPHLFAGFPFRFDDTEPVEIAFNAINETDVSEIIPITYTVYSWDAIDEKNFVSEVTRTVRLEPNSTTPLTFTVDDKKHPVYLVEIRMEYEDASSILNVRFVREGLSKLRINFPSITKYPLTAGVENEVFSCLHNVAESFEDARMVLTLLDEQSNEIHSFEYRGEIGSAMAGVVDNFVPIKTYKTFTLNAKLYQNDVLVEESTIKYSCEDFENCDPIASGTQQIPVVFMAALGLICILLIGTIGLIIRKMSTKNN